MDVCLDGPCSLPMSNKSLSGYIVYHVNYEKRVAFGSFPDGGSQQGGKRTVWEPGGQIIANGFFREKAQWQLFTLSTQMQFVLDSVERMVNATHVGGAINANDQQLGG